MFFLWKCGFVSQCRGVWNVDGVSQTLAQGLFSFKKWPSDSWVVKVAKNSTYEQMFREECQRFKVEIYGGRTRKEKSTIWINARKRQVNRSGKKTQYGLVLFPSLTGVISLEAAAAFVEHENTHVNPITAIFKTNSCMFKQSYWTELRSMMS